MAHLPMGTVTFLLTDIEGSTVLWEQRPGAMQQALARHDAILREAIGAHRGHVFKTMGDAFCAAFSTAPEALAAAADAQRTLHGEAWGETGPLRVRMVLHTGAAELRDGDYLGPPLNRAARLLTAAHGGQVLVSQVAQDLVRDQLPPDATLRDLGEHRLKDLPDAERVFQLVVPAVPADFPALKSLEARPNNLPVQLAPLIGREREVEAMRALLRREDVRLVTLTGPGGTGKTRLGLQVAADLLDRVADGVFFVGLAPIADPGLVPSAIAQALRIREGGGRPILDILKDYLRDKQLLLVLDNFEQVLAAATLIADLLGACPRLKVLVTSRAALHLRREKEFGVPPLALPEPGSLPPTEVLSQYAAVALFIQRAQDVRPTFAFTDEHAAAVTEICRRLDGLPLAIELAAARIKLLSPEAMLARLERRLLLLTGGARDLPARQQTLRGAIAWSYDLLDHAEQQLFRRLAVFVGGCTLEAVGAISEGRSLKQEGDPAIDVLDGVASLVDKSLLLQEAGILGEPRFGMLETIREYGLERLDATGEAAETRRRYAEHYLALAESAWPGLAGRDQAAWFERLEAEHDNFRAVLAWSQEESEDAALGLRLAGALAWFWYVRGHFTEGRRWLDLALARGCATTPSVRAKALLGAGLVTRQQGDLARSEQHCEAALETFQTLGDRSGIATARAFLAIAVLERGQYERASALFEQGLALARELGDRWCAAIPLQWLGALARGRGEYTRATALLEESLTLRRGLGEKRGVAYCLRDLGRVAYGVGDYARAAELLDESMAMSRELGDRRGIGQGLYCLGVVANARGDDRRASTYFAEGLSLRREIGDQSGLAESLEGCGMVARHRGRIDHAARLFGAAEILRETIGGPLLPADRAALERVLTAVRSAMGEEAFAAAWAEGRGMSLEQAVAYALDALVPA